MKKPKFFIALLRMALGWIFLYQGIFAITHPEWTLAPFIENAQTFPAFYAFMLASPMILYASYVAKGIFVITGALLIVGVGVRFATILGIALMLFFYFPQLHFPYVGESYYIVNEHMMYIIVLIYLFTARSGEYFGLGTMFKSSRY